MTGHKITGNTADKVVQADAKQVSSKAILPPPPSGIKVH